MKTTVKQLSTVTFIALFLIAIGVRAEGTTTKHSVYEATETTLQLEEWMTNETIWNTTDMELFVQETEANLEVEAWMTNHRTWHAHFNLFNETESGLELENWMINEFTWEISEATEEQKLVVEDWMINSEYWK